MSGATLSKVTFPVFESWTVGDWNARSLYRVVEAPKGSGSHEFTHFATDLSYGEVLHGLLTESARPRVREFKLEYITYYFNELRARRRWLSPIREQQWPDTRI